MLSRLLDATAERQLAETRGVLAELRDLLIRAPATDEDAATLSTAVAQLDDVFLLVVVGEFNAGKSAFVNALVGAQLLNEGVTPTTSCVHLLRYGEQAASERLPSGVLVVSAPVDLLRDVHIVDTPGTNAIIREHEQITAGFMPRSDLVLFVTSSDRPFTETERAFLETIRDWGKKIVLVVNKVDIFERPEQLEEVVVFVREAATRLLGVTPEIFPVSARWAWRAKHGEPSVWAGSGFAPLERFIHDTLDESGRFQLKLANPLGVGDALARRYASVADERAALLADDVAAMEDVERQLAAYRDDLLRGFELRMNGIEKVLLEMEARGHQYFEDTLRIARVLDLLNRARVQREFEERVVGDAPQQVERRVTELIDWLVDQDFRAMAGRHRAARGPAPRAWRSGSRRRGDGNVHRGSGAAARLGRTRSAARRRHLRSATRVAGHCRCGAAVGGGDSRGRRQRARPWRDRRGGGDHCGGGCHWISDGERPGGGRLSDCARAATSRPR